MTRKTFDKAGVALRRSGLIGKRAANPFGWAALLATAVLPSIAAAQGPAAEHEAQLRFEEGMARVKANNFEGARSSFVEAYAVLHRPSILWNLALAEEKSDHLLEAARDFREFIRTAQGGDDRTSAERHLVDLMGKIGHLDVRAPAGADLVVDGVLVGHAPLAEAVDVLPGRHHVEERSGSEIEARDAQIDPGQVVRVVVGPQQAVNAEGWSLSGASTEEARPPVVAPPVEARREGRPAQKTESASRVVTVVAVAAVATVSLALGAYYGLQSQADKSTVDGFHALYSSSYCFGMPSSTQCVQWNDAVQAENRDATRSNVFYVTGAVLGAGAIATWFLWPRSGGTSTAAATLVPFLSPGHLGLAAAGRF